MEVDKHMNSQHGIHLIDARQARSGSSQSMGPPHQRSLQSNLSPKQNGYGRSSVAQQYFPHYAANELNQSHMSNQQLHSVGSGLGLNPQYSSYQQVNERSHQVNSQTSVQQYSTYQTNPVLPPLLSAYDMVPQYSTRPPNIPGNMHSQYSVQTYPQSNNQMSMCMDNNASHLMSSQPEMTAYDSVSFCRPEISAPYLGYSSNYEYSEHEAQPEHETDIDPGDAHSTLHQCELAIKSVFDAIVLGRLNDAGTRLLAASQWLSSSVIQLGLHLDDAAQYENRLTIWRNINHCWEALAQKQNNILKQELLVKKKISGKLPRTKVQRMVDELITICDHLEEFGLVDYEMGLWEEQIVDAFIICLDLQNKCDNLFSDNTETGKNVTKRISPASKRRSHER